MRLNSNLYLHKIMLFIFVFGIVVLDNGSILMKAIKVLIAMIALLFSIRKGTIRCDFIIGWFTFFTIYAATSILWAYSFNTAKGTLQTIVLNLICICAYLQLIRINQGQVYMIFKYLTFLPIIYVFRLLMKFGFNVIVDGFRNVEEAQNSMHNRLGMYSAFAICFIIVLRKQMEGKKKNILDSFLLANCYILVVSGSRKAFFYVIIPIVIYYLLKSNNPKRILKYLMLMMCAVGIVYICIIKIPFLYEIAGRGVNDLIHGFLGKATDNSTIGRLRLTHFGIEVFKKRPIFGYGLENFKALHASFYGNEMIADNNYVELLVDQGIVGLIIYYSFHIVILFKLLKRRVAKKTNLMLNMLIGIVIAILICDYGVCSYRNLYILTLLSSIWCFLETDRDSYARL